MKKYIDTSYNLANIRAVEIYAPRSNFLKSSTFFDSSTTILGKPVIVKTIGSCSAYLDKQLKTKNPDIEPPSEEIYGIGWLHEQVTNPFDPKNILNYNVSVKKTIQNDNLIVSFDLYYLSITDKDITQRIQEYRRIELQYLNMDNNFRDAWRACNYAQDCINDGQIFVELSRFDENVVLLNPSIKEVYLSVKNEPGKIREKVHHVEDIITLKNLGLFGQQLCSFASDKILIPEHLWNIDPGNWTHPELTKPLDIEFIQKFQNYHIQRGKKLLERLSVAAIKAEKEFEATSALLWKEYGAQLEEQCKKVPAKIGEVVLWMASTPNMLNYIDTHDMTSIVTKKDEKLSTNSSSFFLPEQVK